MILLWLVVAAVLLSPLRFWNGCCCTTTGTATINVIVRGCAGAPTSDFAGITITCTETGVTAVTNSVGLATFGSLAAGTYHFTWTGPTGYNSGSATATVTTGGTTNVTSTMTVATGYSCTRDVCLQNSGGSAPYPAPRTPPSTLYLTDSFGTVTLTRVTSGLPGGVNYLWTAVDTRPASDSYPSPYTLGPGCSLPTAPVGAADVPVQFAVYCLSGSGDYQASITCYDSLRQSSDPLCTTGDCAQGFLILTWFNNSLQSTAYPSQGTDSLCSPNGAWHGSAGTATGATRDPVIAGSASIIFETFPSGQSKQTMPYYIYGASESVTYSE